MILCTGYISHGSCHSFSLEFMHVRKCTSLLTMAWQVRMAEALSKTDRGAGENPGGPSLSALTDGDVLRELCCRGLLSPVPEVGEASCSLLSSLGRLSAPPLWRRLRHQLLAWVTYIEVRLCAHILLYIISYTLKFLLGQVFTNVGNDIHVLWVFNFAVE